jgi:hypothetical protein
MAQPQANRVISPNRAHSRGHIIVLVHPGLSRQWEVAAVGQATPQSFADLDLAVSYAQLWAAMHRPSTVRILADDGVTEQEWSFN